MSLVKLKNVRFGYSVKCGNKEDRYFTETDARLFLNVRRIGVVDQVVVEMYAENGSYVETTLANVISYTPYIEALEASE